MLSSVKLGGVSGPCILATPSARLYSPLRKPMQRNGLMSGGSGISCHAAAADNGVEQLPIDKIVLDSKSYRAQNGSADSRPAPPRCRRKSLSFHVFSVPRARSGAPWASSAPDRSIAYREYPFAGRPAGPNSPPATLSRKPHRPSRWTQRPPGRRQGTGLRPAGPGCRPRRGRYRDCRSASATDAIETPDAASCCKDRLQERRSQEGSRPSIHSPAAPRGPGPAGPPSRDGFLIVEA